MTTYNFLYGIY